MKRYYFLALVLVASVAFTAWAAGQESPQSHNLRELRVAPDFKTKSLMKQYVVLRAKAEKLARTFGNVHGTLGTGEYAGIPEDRVLVIVRPTLGVLKDFLNHQSDKGHGNLDYWLRTHSLNRTQGTLARQELQRLLSQCGEDLSPLLRAAIKNVATNLEQAMAKFNNGYGDLDYWISASAFVRDAMHQAAANLDEIINALPNVAGADPMAILRAHTNVVANVMRGQSNQGNGDIDYWIRTHSLLTRQCAWGRDSLQTLLGFVGGKVLPLLRNAIKNVIDNLDQTAGKYSGGYGNLDYWIRAGGYVKDGMHRGAADLNQILDSI